MSLQCGLVKLVDNSGAVVEQYVALGPRIKIVISNILSASTRNELKFSLKVAFMFLAIILKWQVSNGDIFLVIRKKGGCARRPFRPRMCMVLGRKQL